MGGVYPIFLLPFRSSHASAQQGFAQRGLPHRKKQETEQAKAKRTRPIHALLCCFTLIIFSTATTDRVCTPGSDYVLTVETDNFPGTPGDDSFLSKVAGGLSSDDVLNGAGGNNTSTVVDSGDFNPGSPNVSNIQHASLSVDGRSPRA
jgi:hypothetical protein